MPRGVCTREVVRFSLKRDVMRRWGSHAYKKEAMLMKTCTKYGYGNLVSISYIGTKQLLQHMQRRQGTLNGHVITGQWQTGQLSLAKPIVLLAPAPKHSGWKT